MGADAERYDIYIGGSGSRRKAEARTLVVFMLAVAAAVLFAGSTGQLPIHIQVDGRPVWIERDTTVADLIDRGIVSAPRGDLYSVEGRLIGRREGGAPLVEVDGRSAREDHVVTSASEVVSRQGSDTTETILHRVVETTAPVRFVGAGPMEQLVSTGAPCRVLVSMGEKSGIEIDRVQASPAVPAVVRRAHPRTKAKLVALTFDDGPWPRSTEAVLAILRKEKAKATFFMIGDLVDKRTGIASQVVEAGMEIGTHSQSHTMLRQDSSVAAVREVDLGIETVDRCLGVRPNWYRPAGGAVNGYLYKEAERRRLLVARWNVDPRDYRRVKAKTIARRVLKAARPGSVILLHDGGGDRTQTVKALKSIIRGLRKKGYRLVTLSELYGIEGPKQAPAGP